MSSLFNFFDKRVQCCSGRPDIVYRFKNKNLLTFEENLKYRGDLPFVTYCDFETTRTSRVMYNPEDHKMFPVSYVIIFALHPDLPLKRVIVQRRLIEKLVLPLL